LLSWYFPSPPTLCRYFHCAFHTAVMTLPPLRRHYAIYAADAALILLPLFAFAER